MKSICIFFALLFPMALARGQQTTEFDTVTRDQVEMTLKAAKTMCVISLTYQLVGIGFFIGATTDVNDWIGPGSAGVLLATGGAGMELNNAQLTRRAYDQIGSFSFLPEDSLMKVEMLKNIKTARILAVMQNLVPFIALATGGFAYLISGSESKVFSITTITCWAGGLLSMAIPEIMLIEKTRRDLNKYQQRLTMGPSKYGMGMIFHF
jgi:hypothetical protein